MTDPAPKPKGLILAAGRGSRLGNLTEVCPKAFVELGGRPLIDWQISTLNKCGLNDIAVVTGYRADYFDQIEHQVHKILNPDWDRSSIAQSLTCAEAYIDRPTVVSYSDIVYSPQAVHPLLDESCFIDADLAVAYDPHWLSLWQRRFDDPLSDAESFKVDRQGWLLDIGRKVTDVNEIEGQYIGLFRIGPAGLRTIYRVCSRAELQLMDMTALFAKLIKNGVAIKAVPISGGWCEIDTQNDLDVGAEMVAAGQIRN